MAISRYVQSLALIAEICAADFTKAYGEGAQQRHQFACTALAKGQEDGLRKSLRKLVGLLQPEVEAALIQPLKKERARIFALYCCLQALAATDLATATQALQLAHEHWAKFLSQAKK